MSADNTLAILKDSNGEYRIADIHCVWNGSRAGEDLLSNKRYFEEAEVFHDEEAVSDHIEYLYEHVYVGGYYVEYGETLYEILVPFADWAKPEHLHERHLGTGR